MVFADDFVLELVEDHAASLACGSNSQRGTLMSIGRHAACQMVARSLQSMTCAMA